MVDKAINNRQNWNALNNGICHISHHIPESKKMKERRDLITTQEQLRSRMSEPLGC